IFLIPKLQNPKLQPCLLPLSILHVTFFQSVEICVSYCFCQDFGLSAAISAVSDGGGRCGSSYDEFVTLGSSVTDLCSEGRGGMVD
ncbi:hypothetical protein M8C21_028721, partial [Ambrosia artemisiifolia]